MRVAYLSPLPPSQTGIAHYSSMVLPALARRLDVTAFGSIEQYERESFDLAIYQLGNNPHHEWIYREAMQNPGIAVLHDVVLHHLIVEMTLARGDAEGYAAALAASHGAVGEAWARGRAAGLHDEIGNFLLPGSVDLANRSRAVIVHNGWAAAWLASLGVRVPIHVVPHPAVLVPPVDPAERDETRSRFGITPENRVIGFFGFLTSAKRGEVVLEAFAAARDPNLRLLVVGEPAPNIPPGLLDQPGVITTGYVTDAEFDACYAAADRLVNLRYPSAGESSGTLLRAFGAGKPVAVSDYAQFAEYPDACAVRIPLGEGEVQRLAQFFRDPLDERAIADAQRAWIGNNATVAHCVDGYLRAIGEAKSDVAAHRVTREVALFPQLSVVALQRAVLELRNEGDFTIRTRLYGKPEYRLLAKLFDADREIEDRWIPLDRDLRPGDTATVEIPFRTGTTLRLYHALEGIPMLEPEAWFEQAL